MLLVHVALPALSARATLSEGGGTPVAVKNDTVRGVLVRVGAAATA